MTVLVSNDAVGALASSINTSVLTLALGSGQGALFPNPGAGEYFYVTAIRASDGGKEIMRCTARSTDTLTVVRAQDGTTAKSFATSDRVELRPIRAVHLEYAQKNDPNTFVGNQTITGNLTVSADLAVQDDLIVTDDATIGGDLAVTGSLTVTGTVSCANGSLMAGRKLDAFNAGVTMLFRQSSVPTGWTKITTWNDAALRIVSGTPSQKADAGDEFTTLLGSRTIAQANLPNVNLTAQSAGAHEHFLLANVAISSGSTVDADNYIARQATSTGSSDFTYAMRPTATAATVGRSSSTGAHQHTVSLGGSGTPLPFDVNYVDVYLASKDA